jgi:hypothetical protein
MALVIDLQLCAPTHQIPDAWLLLILSSSATSQTGPLPQPGLIETAMSNEKGWVDEGTASSIFFMHCNILGDSAFERCGFGMHDFVDQRVTLGMDDF